MSCTPSRNAVAAAAEPEGPSRKQLIALFENLWRMVLALRFSSDEEVGLPSLDEPGHDELRLLSLFATGLLDSTIVARLGISHRTYQRRLRSGLGRLGARTRFQAGIRAARRGWI